MPDGLAAFADGGRFALRIGEERTFRLNRSLPSMSVQGSATVQRPSGVAAASRSRYACRVRDRRGVWAGYRSARQPQNSQC
jgi:hypothetical protein